MSELALKLIAEENKNKTGKLDLGRCGLTEIPKELLELTWLKELKLTGNYWSQEELSWILTANKGPENQIKTLPQDLSRLRNLKELQIDCLDATLTGVSTLSTLTTLQKLYLRRAHLKDISFVRPLTQLQSLDLSYNSFSLPQGLDVLTGLNHLVLINTKVKDFSSIGGITALKSLNIQDSTIKDISFIRGLTNLEFLHIGSGEGKVKYCNLDFLQDFVEMRTLGLYRIGPIRLDFLKHLTKLTDLYLGAIDKPEIKLLKPLTQLRALKLPFNQIDDGSSLQSLSHLRKLDLRHNQIRDITFLAKFEHLRSLQLDHNAIEDISILKNLKQLQTLSLADNSIVEITSLEGLTQLESLDLIDNQVRDLNPLSSLHKLKNLFLNENGIEDINVIQGLPGLQKLDLSRNRIRDISALENLFNTTELNLSKNQIQDISGLLNLIKNTSLRVTMEEFDPGLNLADNPISTPPMEIMKQGTEAILSYFEGLNKENRDFLFEAKLLTIGQSGAGKTTFSNKILKNTAKMPREDDTTRGIDVRAWTFSLSHEDLKSLVLEDDAIRLSKRENNFKVNLWDFGGQEIFHGTHQFFLTHRSLYVLLADTRKQDTDFNYWMNLVEQLGGGSPLMVVLNEKQNHRWRIDELRLRSRFSFFKETRSLDLSEHKNFTKLEDLRRTIKHLLKSLPHIGDPLPESWAEVRKSIAKERETHKYISYDRFLEICQIHGVYDPQTVVVIDQYFHDIGVYLHYAKDPILKSKIFLDSDWTTDTVYQLLNDRTIEDRNGRFDKKDITRIWSEKEQVYIHHELLQLLERFGIAYPMKQSGDFIAPEHLPEVEPLDLPKWDYHKALLFGYQFDQFMPKGLMVRLIVKLHRYIENQDWVWHRGVRLKKEGTEAEIREIYGNVNQFNITVIGDYQREFLWEISAAFEEILSGFPKLEYEQKVPCNCEKCNTSADKHFYTYEELKRKLKNRRETIDCPSNEDKPVPIRPMIEDTMGIELERNSVLANLAKDPEDKVMQESTIHIINQIHFPILEDGIDNKEPKNQKANVKFYDTWEFKSIVIGLLVATASGIILNSFNIGIGAFAVLTSILLLRNPRRRFYRAASTVFGLTGIINALPYLNTRFKWSEKSETENFDFLFQLGIQEQPLWTTMLVLLSGFLFYLDFKNK